MATQQHETPAIPAKEKGLVTYQVAGQDVKLSYQIVRDFLTKGNGAVTDQDLTQFISICKYNQLNPFLNEAYLIKFGTQPATMVVAKEAFFKRADSHDKYDGIQAGIIVLRDGQPVDVEGCFHLKTDQLIGGWAIVHRSDRKFPIVSRVNLSEYDKGQSNWKEKPSTMISKVAKVQALREAFPVQLGAMYTAEEQTIDIAYEDLSETSKKIAEEAKKQSEAAAKKAADALKTSKKPDPVAPVEPVNEPPLGDAAEPEDVKPTDMLFDPEPSKE